MNEYFNAVAHTWQWTASFGALTLVFAWQLYTIVRAEIRKRRRRKSFETYRDTGQVDETFDSLSSAAAEAAGRAHGAVVSKRILDQRYFAVATACPKCGHVDNHHISDVDLLQDSDPNIMYQVITRRCTACNFGWSQFG